MTTFVSEGPVLSSGQKQRRLIARVVARRPAILMLDEATSGLDEELQARIFRHLRREELIVVSHRAATLDDVDRLSLRGPFRSRHGD